MTTRRSILSWLGLAPVAVVVPIAAAEEQDEPFSPTMLMDLKTERTDEEVMRMIDENVRRALRQYDVHLGRTLPARISQAEARGL